MNRPPLLTLYRVLGFVLSVGIPMHLIFILKGFFPDIHLFWLLAFQGWTSPLGVLLSMLLESKIWPELYQD